MLKLQGYNLLYVHILPGSHSSFVLPPKQGLDSNQNKGHLGSRYPVLSWREFFGPTVQSMWIRRTQKSCELLGKKLSQGKNQGTWEDIRLL